MDIYKNLANGDSKAHFLKIEDEEYDFMDILPKEIIPVYFENSFPKNHLRTKITFNDICKKENVRISLKNNLQKMADYHHQFAVFEKDTIPVFSSSIVEISPQNPLTLSFSGRITDNYSSTLLTFQSENHNYSRFDIVFFKNLPWFVRYVITITVSFLYLFILSMSILFINNKQNILNLFTLG